MKCCQQFFLHHLVFGQLQTYYMPFYKRSLLLSATIFLLLGLNGLVFSVFEDVDEGTSKEEFDFLEYLWISITSSSIAWIFTMLIDFVIYKCENNDSKKKFGNIVYIILIGLMYVLAALSVGFLCFVYCLDWSKIWCVLFLFSVLMSGLVLETITVLIKIKTKARIY